MGFDLTNDVLRRKAIGAIKGEENKRRKAEGLKRYEIYKERAGRYILAELRQEFTEATIRGMRKITSINVAPAIINQLASLYNAEPIRDFSNVDDDQRNLLESIYFNGSFDPKFRMANRYFKLHSQCTMQVIPKNGKVSTRILQPHQYDVIPSDMDPEIGEIYIVNVFDKFEFIQGSDTKENLSNPASGGFSLRSSEIIDGRNQVIGDADDYQASLERYEVWSKDFNFLMDGNGRVVSDPEDMINPIGMLPFVDVADFDKDFEYWVRRTNGVIEFTLDFGKILSDISNIIRMQGYAQSVVSSVKEPKGLNVGVERMIWLQQDPTSTVQPSFQFVSPNPDINGSLEFLDMILRLFLTSMGVDPKKISGKLEAKSFSSGVERLLSMIEQFEASKTDMDLFRWVEGQVFKRIVAWSNLFNNLPDSQNPLDEEFRGPIISEDVDMEIKYVQPQAIQTKQDVENSTIKLLEKKLISRKDAMKELFEIDDDMAMDKLKEIDEESALRIPAQLVGINNGKDNQRSDEDISRQESETEIKS